MTEIIRDRETFSALAQQWNDLAEPFCNPLLRHEWFLSCLCTLYTENALHVIIVRLGDEMIAAAPLIIVEHNGIQWLEIIGVSHLHEPSGLLYRDTTALENLVNAVISLRQPLLLSRINQETPLFHTMQKGSKGKGLVVRRQTNPSGLVQCSTSWQEYYGSISSRRRYDHRRARKRADQKGKVTFRTLKPEQHNLQRCLAEAFAVEAAGWKGRKGSALLSNTDLQAFFLEYGAWSTKYQMLRLFFMDIDNQPAAMQICVEYADSIWILKTGYDEAHKECSPGVLLMNYALEYAFTNNFTSFEFLGSQEPWLEVWTTALHRHLALVYYPYGISGFISLSSDIFRSGLKKLKKTFL